MLTSSYLLSLGLTIAIELPIAFLIGLRTGLALLAVAIINIFTNPFANFAYSTFVYYSVNWVLAITAVEVAVVLLEWKMLEYALFEKGVRLLKVSILLNAASFLAGLFLFR